MVKNIFLILLICINILFMLTDNFLVGQNLTPFESNLIKISNDSSLFFSSDDSTKLRPYLLPEPQFTAGDSNQVRLNTEKGLGITDLNGSAYYVYTTNPINSFDFEGGEIIATLAIFPPDSFPERPLRHDTTYHY